MSYLKLFKCQKCGSDFFKDESKLLCKNCSANFKILRSNIFDFVSGKSKTLLDYIDYDRVYSVTDDYSSVEKKSSISIYDQIEKKSKNLWRKSIGSTIEIGSGTGRFTTAILKKNNFSNFLITDISTKMLELCKERIARLNLQKNNVQFATFSGQEDCFKNESFDTCFGIGVVHHICYLPLFFKKINDILKPEGRAFFIEPNLKFHSALISTVAEIINYLISTGIKSDDKDIILITNWLSEIRFNILNSGNYDVLKDREDKHLFTKEQLQELSKRAGFGTCRVIPFEYDPFGNSTLTKYMSQIGVTNERKELILSLIPKFSSRYLDLLNNSDKSGSYLICLSKEKLSEDKSIYSRKIPKPKNKNTSNHTLKYALDITVYKKTKQIEIELSGWCFSIEDILSINIMLGSNKFLFPIWQPRRDLMILEKNNVYQFINILCSGVSNRDLIKTNKNINLKEISIQALTSNNEVIPIINNLKYQLEKKISLNNIDGLKIDQLTEPTSTENKFKFFKNILKKMK